MNIKQKMNECLREVEVEFQKESESVLSEERVYPEQVAAVSIDIMKVKGLVNSLFVHTGDASGHHRDKGGKNYVRGEASIIAEDRKLPSSRAREIDPSSGMLSFRL